MALNLLYGFRNKKFWFPYKYFSLNAASVTVIPVAVKPTVDLSSSMPGNVDQVAKIGILAFMCTIMSNLMPSLASMDNKSLLANVTGLSILVITLIANISIQIRTHLHSRVTLLTNTFDLFCYHNSCLKNILELTYEASSTTLNDQNPQEDLISKVEKLRRLVKRYWIMAETGSPQFVMASNALSSASGIICAISMLMYMYMALRLLLWGYSLAHGSVYRWSMISIVITQSIGIVVGSIAPIFRCFTVSSFKSFGNQNRKHFLVFKV
ncbi:hypothetical protein HanHA300_Chr06g0209811 [Helianthus annuus]|nr:hypothetical protein HanHA300_Chr06g0209811 [Helianthus annuus]